jgi:hypothetical protein
MVHRPHQLANKELQDQQYHLSRHKDIGVHAAHLFCNEGPKFLPLELFLYLLS